MQLSTSTTGGWALSMSTIRLILAAAILLFAAYIVVMNWGCVVVSIRNKRRGIDRHHSTVPLLSLFITALAVVVYPWPWMIAVPLLDIANWSLVWAPFGLIWELCRKRNVEPPAPPNRGPTRRPDGCGTPQGPPSAS